MSTNTASVPLIDYVDRINNATVYDVAKKTPLEPANKLSRELDNDIRFKREDMQPVFSFKLRGAYNRISQLTEGEKSQGVICASAGNHAQGVAYSANFLKLNATIVMPVTTPPIKVDAVKRFGGKWANVVLFGDSFDVAKNHALELAEKQNLVFIPPYDDATVIAGQGTVGKELHDDWADMEYVFVATGGGGLVAGVAAYLGNAAPHVKVIAVEPVDAACLKIAMDTGERKTLPQVGLFVDGVAVAQIGEAPFEVVNLEKSDGSSKLIEQNVITCTHDEVCAAIKDVFEENRSIVEPAGALAVAGMKKYVQQHNLSGKNIGVIICGANMNFDRLRYIAERTEIGESKEGVFAVTIPERTGAFLQFCRTLHGRSITEFNYRYNPKVQVESNDQTPIFVGLGLTENTPNGTAERKKIAAELTEQGYGVYDLTEDDIAKNHIRHLIGGHSGLADEQIYKVRFPERPNALLNFLEKLGQDFNITLFHYRNHGAALGRVLVGIQVPAEKTAQLEATMQEIGYSCENVTENMSFKLFLG